MITISPILKNYILRKYFSSILSNKNTICKDNLFQFRCNVCGDSKSNNFKKRGYLLLRNNKWVFKCHNCGVSMIAEKWFKNYFPSQYKQYIIELLKNNEEENQEHIASKYRDISIKKNVVIKKEDNEEKEISSFFPILKGNTDLFDKAREFCKKRLIPEKIWHRWYVSTKNRYGRRIIIPFYDNENKIYYYQARTISNQIPKYTSRVGEKQIYNIYNVDKTKPIQVCEGPIDSCFLENSIATLGCSLADDKLDFIKKLGKVYWLFDFDEAGLKESNKYISDGEYVFLWKKFIKEFNLSGMVSNQKIDINDVIVHLNKKDGFTFEELEKFYSSSIYDKIWL